MNNKELKIIFEFEYKNKKYKFNILDADEYKVLNTFINKIEDIEIRRHLQTALLVQFELIEELGGKNNR